MASALHIARLREGARAWNAWRANQPDVPVDLSGGDLSGADLPEVVLAGADLSHVRLQHADLTGADLRDANLHRTNLVGARLDGANLGGARHLTQDQIERAFGDKATVLPHGLSPPREWLRAAPITGVARTQPRRRRRPGAEDPYAILGVGRRASAREIRTAYLKLVKELHPDGRAAAYSASPPADGADEQLKIINEAYQQLKAGRPASEGWWPRRWTGRAGALFVVGALSSTAPSLLILAFNLSHAGWLGPRGAPAATATTEQRTSGMASPSRPDTTPPSADQSSAAAAALADLARAEARAREEQATWAAAERAGTRDDLPRFVETYPDGAHAGQARQALVRQEQAAWAAAERAGTRDDLQRFVDAYPDGAHAGRARQALADRARAEASAQADRAAWAAAARDGGTAALQRYLADFPSGSHVAEAGHRLAALELKEKETAAWLAAQGRHSKAAYAGYLAAYPDGDRAGEARLRIAELERSEARARETRHAARSHEAKLQAAVLPPTRHLPAAPEPFVGADGRIRR